MFKLDYLSVTSNFLNIKLSPTIRENLSAINFSKVLSSRFHQQCYIYPPENFLQSLNMVSKSTKTPNFSYRFSQLGLSLIQDEFDTKGLISFPAPHPNSSINRLDFAFDRYDSNRIKKIISFLKRYRIKGARTLPFSNTVKIEDNEGLKTMYLGVRNKLFFVRIYDKLDSELNLYTRFEIEYKSTKRNSKNRDRSRAFLPLFDLLLRLPLDPNDKKKSIDLLTYLSSWSCTDNSNFLKSADLEYKQEVDAFFKMLGSGCLSPHRLFTLIKMGVGTEIYFQSRLDKFLHSETECKNLLELDLDPIGMCYLKRFSALFDTVNSITHL